MSAFANSPPGIIAAVSRRPGSLNLNPDLWSAHCNIAQSYFELKEPKKALPHYEEAIGLA